MARTDSRYCIQSAGGRVRDTRRLLRDTTGGEVRETRREKGGEPRGRTKNGAKGRNRTVDTRLFRPLLYRLSYLRTGQTICRRAHRGPARVRGHRSRRADPIILPPLDAVVNARVPRSTSPEARRATAHDERSQRSPLSYRRTRRRVGFPTLRSKPRPGWVFSPSVRQIAPSPLELKAAVF